MLLYQIAGYKSVNAFITMFPGKFDAFILEKFIRADIKGDSQNLKGILFEKYQNDITKLGLGCEDIPIKLKKWIHQKMQSPKHRFDPELSHHPYVLLQ